MNRLEIIEGLKQAGWDVVTRRRRAVRFPGEIRLRYPHLPESLTDFLSGLSSCVSRSQQVWFLCEADYNGTNGGAFRWDAWERMSVEAAGDDQREIASINAFWDVHFPFLFSVHSDYAYHAVRTDPENFGQVVEGFSPYLEEPSDVADSFDEFLLGLVDGSIRV